METDLPYSALEKMVDDLEKKVAELKHSKLMVELQCTELESTIKVFENRIKTLEHVIVNMAVDHNS